jgi:putative resolvase
VQCPGGSVGKIVKEWGSEVNDQRPKFLALLANPTISRIVVEQKDRASRFGVASIQTLLALEKRELVIVNTADTTEDDLMGAFVAIITSFAARLYGRRCAKRKTEHVLAALQQDGPWRESQRDQNH